MYLALVRNECFYKIHKRKTYFSLQNRMTLYLSLLLGPVSFLKLLESEDESFPPSLKINIIFFSLPSSLPSIIRAIREGNLGLVLPLGTEGTL